jgi:hypothetical protein
MESHGGIILTGENDEIGEKFSQCHFVYGKSYME